MLVFTIEAPRAGDPLFVLQKGYDRAPAGRIFVRRHGKTEEAGPTDVRALEARGQAARPKVELAVTRADETGVLQAANFTGDKLKQWLAGGVSDSPSRPSPSASRTTSSPASRPRPASLPARPGARRDRE